MFQPYELLRSQSRGQYFIEYFPMAYMRTMLTEINSRLDPSLTPIEYWEFLCWIGIWFLLATVTGYSRKQFWDFSERDRRFVGAPFTVQDLMSESRFNFIMTELFYTAEPYPTYQYPFHLIRALQDAWNKHIQLVFIASWLVCLDKSM